MRGITKIKQNVVGIQQYMVDCIMHSYGNLVINDKRIAYASGSKDKSNKKGEKTQPCRLPLGTLNCEVQIFPVNTIAVGLE